MNVVFIELFLFSLILNLVAKITMIWEYVCVHIIFV